MREAVLEKIASCRTLPSLPAAAADILRLTRSDDAGLKEVARIVEQDAVLTARLLGAVNSPFYGIRRKVRTVSQAVVLLGMQSVKAQLLGLILHRTVDGGSASRPWITQHWRRSMYSAAAARELARCVLPNRADECFIAALLMDIGVLVLDHVFPEQHARIMASADSHLAALEMESRSLKITHAEASGLLARHWRLPEGLTEVMRAHHEPARVRDPGRRPVAELIWLAGRCADIFIDKADVAGSIAAVRNQCAEAYGLEVVDCDEVLREIGRRTMELAEVFEVRLGPAADYDKILATANEQLARTVASPSAVKGIEQRRAPRIKLDGAIHVLSMVEGKIHPPVQVKLRDISANGLSVVHTAAVEPRTQLLVQVPHERKRVTTYVYTVIRCIESEPGKFVIGAELSSVLRPGARPSASR